MNRGLACLGRGLGFGLLAAMLLPAVRAQTTGGLLVGTDCLTGGRESWQNTSTFVEHKAGDGRIGGLRVNATERFGLADRQLEGFYVHPLSKRLAIGVDASTSPTHRVLARHSLGTSLQYEMAPAWLLHAAARQLRYDAVTVNQVSLGAEHYFGNWGAAISAYNSHAYAENALTWVGRLSRYYGERDRINLLLAAGREPTSLAGSIVTSDVRSLTLTGRHWLSPTLAIDYSLGTARQGDFYSRTGGSLGLVVAF